jgi:hypothetical protein
MEVEIQDLVLAVGKQVRDFAARIEEEEITDTSELNTFSKLCNTYNRMLETAGQGRKDNNTDNPLPDLFEMSQEEFYRKMDRGELEDYSAAAVYERELMCQEPENGGKPKLFIPAD